jgi:hypothetical protein
MNDIPAEAYAAAADVILEGSGQFSEAELAAIRGRVGQRNEQLRAVVDAVWPLAVAAGRRQRDEELFAGAVEPDGPIDDETPLLAARLEREVRAKVAAQIRAVDVQHIIHLGGDTVRVGLTVAARIAESPTEGGSVTARVQVPVDALRALLGFHEAWQNTGGFDPGTELVSDGVRVTGIASLTPFEDYAAMDAAADAVEPHLSVLRTALPTEGGG